MAKEEHKKVAIAMRRQGKTYAEILDVVHVAKSTLSIWLRSVDLAQAQKQRITELRRDAQRRGAAARKQQREQDIEHHQSRAKEKIRQISADELTLIATALYWAEGAKQNARSKSAGIQIGNSDPRLLLVFREWLIRSGVEHSELVYELYIHRDRMKEAELFKKWWSRKMHIPAKQLTRIYFKRGNSKTKRSNTGDLYHGLLRIRVKESTSLNREISGYISAIADSLGFS